MPCWATEIKKNVISLIVFIDILASKHECLVPIKETLTAGYATLDICTQFPSLTSTASFYMNEI